MKGFHVFLLLALAAWLDVAGGSVSLDLSGQEEQILQQLYHETDGSNSWIRKWGWESLTTNSSDNDSNSTVHHCLWEGVVCSTEGIHLGFPAVVELNLPNNGLRGTLSSDYLGDLNFLRYLNLAGNIISSPDVDTEAHLNTTINWTTGILAIQDNVGALKALGIPKLTNLEYLNLARNYNFSGSLEGVVNLTQLTHLSLSGNYFDAPASLRKLTNLQHLDLSENQFSAELVSLGLPDLLHDFLLANGSLHYVDVSGNSFSGDVNTALLVTNSSVNSTSVLTHLDLSHNALEGAVAPLLETYLLSNLTYLDISNNNLTLWNSQEQNASAASLRQLTNLQTFMASDNQFQARIPYIGNMTELERLDLSGNRFYGSLNASGISFCAGLVEVNLARNNLTGTIPPLTTTQLMVLDLSENLISGNLQSLDDLAQDGSLGELEVLAMQNNGLTGSIPYSILSATTSLRELFLSYNQLEGSIRGFFPKLENLERIDLSHNVQSYYDPTISTRYMWGLSGTLTEDIGKLPSLLSLDLSHNILSGSLPNALSQIDGLQQFNIEFNQFSGSIPSSLNFLNHLNAIGLAQNRLTGSIPALGGSEEVIRVVTLAGNDDLKAPAPFKLCDLEELDLRQDPKYCPPERIALVDFYLELKGDDWNTNTNWLSSASHCDWYGITCNSNRTQVIRIELPRNGLSGPISPQLFNLTGLVLIDFTDNDLRNAVPSEIGNLAGLTALRLSYNMLTSLPDTFINLDRLSLLHIHGNRISGNDTSIRVRLNDDTFPKNEIGKHFFIADCGDPTDSVEPFVCEFCDMCCNAFEECGMPLALSVGTLDGQSSSGIIIALVLAGQSFLVLLMWLAFKKWPSIRKRSSGTNARVAAGENSVYGYLLSDSYGSWAITISVAIVQASTYGLFIDAASLANDDSDYVYTWRCPRNGDECSDDSSLGAYGWTIWALLLTTSLLDDIANAVTLLFLSASRVSLHCFCTAFVMLSITILSIYTSFAYNIAIATTNTELIVNAVILLFLNMMDESFSKVVAVFNPKFIERISKEAEQRSQGLMKCAENTSPEEDLSTESIRQGATNGITDDVKEERKSEKSLLVASTETEQNRMEKLEEDVRRLEKLLQKMENKKDE